MSVQPRARTGVEMKFYASLQTCTSCGTRVDPDAVPLHGGGAAWTLAGKCTQCQHVLSYSFVTINDNPIPAPPKESFRPS